jgi:formylglycine-generating enzyme required for sulfatase activity
LAQAAPGQAPAATDFVEGEYWALIIGIDEYAGLPPGKQVLAGKPGAEAIERVLKDRYAFAREQIKKLLDGQASRGGILRQLRGYIRDTQPNDSLLIYFAGHCQVDAASKEVWWLPADATEDDPTSFISLSDMQKMLAQIPARHVLLLADSCISEGFLGASRISGTPTVRDVFQKKSRWVLGSGDLFPKPEGDPRRAAPSAFTSAAVKALQDYQDVYTTPLHIAEILMKQLPPAAAIALKNQPLAGVGDDGGQFMFRLDGASITATAIDRKVPVPAEDARLAGLQQQIEATRALSLPQNIKDQAIAALQRQLDAVQKEIEAKKAPTDPQRAVEQARIEAARKEEEARLAALKQEAEEAARQAELRRQQEEQRFAALRQQEEQRIATLRKEAEVAARQVELKRQQEDQARQAELKRQEEEAAKRLTAERDRFAALRQQEEQRLAALRKEEEERLAQMRAQQQAAPSAGAQTVVARVTTPTIPKPPVVGPRPEDLTSMVLIPAGDFLMGSGPRDGNPDETPQRKVSLNAFHIDKYATTVGRFAKYLEATGADPPEYWNMINVAAEGDYPVVGVDWDQAQAYCKWAGKRLPTEAEWEKAARGTDGRKHPWGNDAPTPQFANVGRGGTFGYTKSLEKVGTYEAGKSPFGIYEMIGNVWQWTADWYDRSYYQNAPEKNPKGPEKGEFKVIRGGSWAKVPLVFRVAARHRAAPTSQTTNIGFRCAKDGP